MASTLYQKIQSSTVVPMEYTSIRNIINQFAEVNDGYAVLYAMLELVHPALQTNAVMSPPKSQDCNDDIHLYAQKFDAWLRYESYANQPYSPREQVNKFINKLSHNFAPVISCVHRLLDAWNPFDITVPEVQKLTALPNTIECFMNKETGQSHAYIHKLHDRKQGNIGNWSQHHSDTPHSELTDKYCIFCGQYGHTTTSCAFMAKLIIASEFLT